MEWVIRDRKKSRPSTKNLIEEVKIFSEKPCKKHLGCKAKGFLFKKLQFLLEANLYKKWC